MPDAHYRRLERLYVEAPINAFYRPTIRVSEGAAEIRMEIRPEFHHAAAAAHGSIYFKALDDAAFFAANSVVRDVFVLTASFNLYLMRPVAAGEVIARGALVQRSRRLLLAESTLVDEAGRELARGSGSFMPSEILLADLETR